MKRIRVITCLVLCVLLSASLVLSTHVVFASTPGTVEVEGIRIDGKNYTKAASGNGSNGGTWSWDGAEVLTLNGFSSDYDIVAYDKLKITTSGENIIGGGIWCYRGTLTIQDAKVSATNIMGSMGLFIWDSQVKVDGGCIGGNDISIRDSDIIINAEAYWDQTTDQTTGLYGLWILKGYGIRTDGSDSDVSIYNSNVKIYVANNEENNRNARVELAGISQYHESNKGDITVENSDVTIELSEPGILMKGDKITIEHASIATDNVAIHTITGYRSRWEDSDNDGMLDKEIQVETNVQCVGKGGSPSNVKEDSLNVPENLYAKSLEIIRDRDGWVKESGGWTYYVQGTKCKNEWVSDTIGAKYYMGSDGYMKTGWQKISGKWYYFGDAGVMRTGWVNTGGQWYYMDSDGVMAHGWEKIGSHWYYFGWPNDSESGAMRTGWIYTDGNWRFMNSSGQMMTGWIHDGGIWYYLHPSGRMASNEYVAGYWINPSGSWTYPHKASWHKSGNRWWYGDTSGWFATNATYKIDGTDYSFDSSGWLIQ